MRLSIPCMQCEESKLIYPKSDQFVEIREDGLYDGVCIAKHKSLITLQNQLFEVLFDIGANAIVDGYYREAVSAFTASLERFYEFFIKVISIKFGIDRNGFYDSWKNVSKHSERQLGAFICLYTLEKKIPPPLLKTKAIEFRNDVIHNGKIPTKSDAIKYGINILDVVRPTLFDLKDNYKKEVGETIRWHLLENREKTPSKQRFYQLVIPTIISIASGDRLQESKSLEEIIRGKERNKQH